MKIGKGDKCGIYEIRCVVSDKTYVGSSCRIYTRWYEHRRKLRLVTHTSPRLQRAWLKHGEDKFVFSVLEECAREVLYEREQHWIDVCKRDYNSMQTVRVASKEMLAKLANSLRLRAAKITHCPHGHEYTPENTYYGKSRGERRCKECNKLRIGKIYASETPERRAARLTQRAQFYQANRERLRKTQDAYSAANKDKKREYDRLYRLRKGSTTRAA